MSFAWQHVNSCYRHEQPENEKQEKKTFDECEKLQRATISRLSSYLKQSSAVEEASSPSKSDKELQRNMKTKIIK